MENIYILYSKDQLVQKRWRILQRPSVLTQDDDGISIRNFELVPNPITARFRSCGYGYRWKETSLVKCCIASIYESHGCATEKKRCVCGMTSRHKTNSQRQRKARRRFAPELVTVPVADEEVRVVVLEKEVVALLALEVALVVTGSKTLIYLSPPQIWFLLPLHGLLHLP